MYTFLLFLALCVGIQAISYETLIQEQWEEFKLEHGKIYKSEDEEQYRRSVYMENFHKINEHNKFYEHGLTSYKMGMNQFGDLPEEEFLRLYSIEMPELSQIENASSWGPWMDIKDKLPELLLDFLVFAPRVNMDDVADLPGDIDWREKGVVTPVKNQGMCGSCWSFSATGALESKWAIMHSKLISLSEQNLIDCSWQYGNQGCSGGWMHWAFQYIKNNGGIDTEESYPYMGKRGYCQYKPENKGATVSNVVLLPKGEDQLELVVGGLGPASVAIQIGENFQLYRSGVYDEPSCTGKSFNHALLVVGWGSLGETPYWLVKNSWGKKWGNKGYIKMSRRKNNQCGIASMASYPEV